MKRILFTLGLLTGLTLTAHSQVIVEGVNINDLDVKYCQMTSYNALLKGKPVITTVDYGAPIIPLRDQEITGPGKSEAPFKSVMDAFQFMEKNGWHCESRDVVFSNGIIYVYHFKRVE